jgi:hypothetical protein
MNGNTHTEFSAEETNEDVSLQDVIYEAIYLLFLITTVSGIVFLSVLVP